MQRRKQLIVLCSVGVLAWRNTVLLRGDRMGNFTVRTWHIWFWIGTIAVAGFIWQIRDLIKKIGGNQNEINFGTSV